MPAFVACKGENNLRLPVGGGLLVAEEPSLCNHAKKRAYQKNRPFATTNYPYSSFLNRDILGSSLLLLRNFLVVEFFFILLVQFVRFFCKFVVQILNVIIF